MGTLTVYFVGLCTHLTRGSSGVTEHRVVLLNASRERLVNGRLVRRHRAQLSIPGGDIPLHGATITVNAESSLVQYHPSYESCIPRLQAHSHIELPPLSAQVANWENPDLAAAYFDASGTFSAGKNPKGAAVAVLTVNTVGNPVLQLTPFDGGKATSYPLEDNAIVFVENVDPREDPPGDHDFLLHFKMLMRVPADADWPRETKGCNALPGPFSGPAGTVGPGCSNSTYP